jgi:MFS family permease
MRRIFGNAFKVLSFRNYRLFFIGQGTSLIGTWMQKVAMSWLVYRLTGSALSLGTVAFTSFIPAFFISPIAGVAVDRFNLRRLLIVTQVVSMLQAFCLWALVAGGWIRTWELYPLSFLLGLADAFDVPGRQSFVVKMIEDRAWLGNAIAMNSSLFNGARLAGPALAGLTIAAWGEQTCFLLNALSYLAALAALLSMRLPVEESQASTRRIRHELAEGWRYVWGLTPVRSILLLLTVVSLVGLPYGTLLPIYADKVFQGGARTLGFLTTCSGLGALVGALFMVQRRGLAGLAGFIPWGTGLMGLGLCGFAYCRNLPLSMAFLVAASFGAMISIASGNTLIQTTVQDDKRGRVMSFFSMSMVGMAPFGGLAYGALGHHFGAPATLFLGGSVTLVAALVFGLRVGIQ